MLLFLLVACAAIEEAPSTRLTTLEDVPFYADDGTLCGPSALAAVLQHSGAAASVGALRDAVYLPGLEGSLQAEMLAAVRRHGRVAVALRGDARALTAALEAGYPVLILQRLGLLWQRSWHYAVVIGYDPDADHFLLRSGTERALRTSRRELLRTWGDAEHWAYVVVAPEVVPPFAARDAYLDGALGLETAERLTAAKAAYRSGGRRWPDEVMFPFGYANVLAREGDLTAAASAYRCLRQRFPGHEATANNLAWALTQLGCSDQALEVLDSALRRADLSEAGRAMLLASREEARQGAGAVACRLPERATCEGEGSW